LKKAYLIFGDETYLTRIYAEKIRKYVTDNPYAMMNTMEFEGKTEIAKITEAAETVPFGAEYRLIEVKDSGLFTVGRKDDTEALSKYMAKSPDFSVFLFTLEKVDKRNALYKAVKKYGYCCEINKLKEKELIEKISEISGGKLSQGLSEYFVKNVGDNLEVLTAEADKLFAYVGDKKITREDIDVACTKSLETKIFDMVAAIGKKNADRALDIYNNLLLAKESPFGINKMIARQFRLILQCKYVAAKKKYGSEQIALELGMRSFIVRDCLEQGKNFDITTLIDAIKDCASTDANIKKGLINAELGVEMLILKYSAKK
jgi:DNA polymerase-3 subunit delta